MSIYNSLSPDKQPAFFELVHHPVLATATLANMWISSGINALRASQARVSANQFADDVETLFEQDYTLEQDYHQLLDGKSLSDFHDKLLTSTHDREMGPHDGPNPRYVLLLAATDGQYVRTFSAAVLLYYDF